MSYRNGPRLTRRRYNAVACQDDNVVVLALTKGKQVTIDRDDYERVSGHCWHAVASSRDDGVWYARSSILVDGRWKTTPMHRLILNASADEIVDHINGDGLDNRRANLRICTNAENIRNSPRRCDNNSGFKGVHRRYNGRWQARIIVNGQRVSLGHFNDEASAAKAYDDAARQHYGEFARTNG
jgi:hypothetical protein